MAVIGRDIEMRGGGANNGGGAGRVIAPFIEQRGQFTAAVIAACGGGRTKQNACILFQCLNVAVEIAHGVDGAAHQFVTAECVFEKAVVLRGDAGGRFFDEVFIHAASPPL